MDENYVPPTEAQVAPVTPTIDPAIAQRMQGMANIPFPSVQGSYPIPKDNSLTGDNWARNLMLFGGAMQDANDARFGQGFLLHPGGGLASGLAGGVKRVSDVDNQNAQTQSFLGTAETNRIANAQSMYHLALQREGMQRPDAATPAQNAGVGGEGPMSGPPSTSISGPSGQSGGYGAVSPDRLTAWASNSAKKVGAPASFGPFFGYGILQNESQGNTDPNLKNPAGDFGVAGLSLATVKNPGFGMKPGDVEMLKRNPEAAVDFAVEYAYRRSTAPVEKGGLGLTAQDLDGSKPGYLAAVAAMYGGASTPEGKQAYVGKVANNILRTTGRQQLANQMPYQDMLAQAWQGVNSGTTASAPTASAPANQRAGMQQVQAAQAAQTPTAAPAPTGIGGGGPDASTRGGPPPRTIEQIAAENAAYAASHNVGSLDGMNTGGSAPGIGSLDGVGPSEGTAPPDATPAAPASPPKVQVAGPGAPTAPTTPAATIPPASAPPAPIAQTGTVPIQPATGNAVPQPGSRADIQSGQPTQIGEQEIRNEVQKRFNKAAQLQADATAIDKMGQFSGNKYQQDQAAAMRIEAQKLNDDARKLQSDYLTKRAETGTFVDAGIDPVTHAPMIRNTATGKTEPKFSGESRMAQAPDGGMFIAPPGGAWQYIPPNPEALRQKHFAEAQGTQQAKDLAEEVKVQDTAFESTNTYLNRIDHALNALDKAENAPDGGIKTGPFNSFETQAKAITDALGVTRSDIHPGSLDYMQEAKKSVAWVKADMWKTMLAGSQNSDARTREMNDAVANTELQPHALRNLLEYQRQQFLYEHDMAAYAKQIKDRNGGNLTYNWKQDFTRDHPQPILDPKTGLTILPTVGTDANGNRVIKDQQGNVIPEGPNRNPPAATKVWPTPSAASLDHIRANPTNVQEYETRYGPGSAARALGNK